VKTVLDSSGWVEFFAGGPLAGRFEPYARAPADLVTPTIVVYEVYKILKRERGEETALIAVASLSATLVSPLTETIALHAADISLQYRLAMADAIVYATSREHGARVVTGDADLKDLPGVVYVA
jgi:predicted nucleic acid-binding protein